MRARPDPLRITAISIAIAAHVVVGLLLFLPSAPLRRALIDDALVVSVVRMPGPPPPVAPPPPSPLRPRPAAAPAPSTAAPDPTPAVATMGSGASVDGSGETPVWRFDPDAGVSVVVYSDRSAMDVPAPEQAPAEIPGYRAGFDPSTVPALSGPAAGGSATFDVLVDETGAPTALVIVQQACGEPALETAMSVVSQWRYVPARRGGTPVAGWLRVTLQF